MEFYVICYIFTTKIHNLTFQKKTPNSRNSTALSAAVYENFCPRGPASNTPSTLVDRHGFFRNPPSPLRCPHGLWMTPMQFWPNCSWFSVRVFWLSFRIPNSREWLFTRIRGIYKQKALASCALWILCIVEQSTEHKTVSIQILRNKVYVH